MPIVVLTAKKGKKMRTNIPSYYDIISRVLPIRKGSHQGTVFVMDTKGNQFLITAAHVVSDLYQKGDVEIFLNDDWETFEVGRLSDISPHPFNDICVLWSEKKIYTEGSIKIDDKLLVTYGQSVNIFGFPLLDQKDFPIDYIARMKLNQENDIRLIPFNRSCIYSNALETGGEDSSVLFHILDGYGSKGMSGGPAVCEIEGELAVLGFVTRIVLGKDGKIEGFIKCVSIAKVIESLNQTEIAIKLSKIN